MMSSLKIYQARGNFLKNEAVNEYILLYIFYLFPVNYSSPSRLELEFSRKQSVIPFFRFIFTCMCVFSIKNFIVSS